jgi:GH15 family glucan-1,4-alpha-glucosidase
MYNLPAPLERWRGVRARIHEDVCAHGFDRELNSFARAYGTKEMDASLLLLPALGFLPIDDPRVQGTIAAVERRLLKDGFVARYDQAASDDGLRGTEGVFLACSFWLADAYVMCGRRDEAVRLFEKVVSLCNDVGLLSEEYEPETRRLIGNFPQAFSHLALVNTASNLAHTDKPAEQRSEAKLREPA